MNRTRLSLQSLDDRLAPALLPEGFAFSLVADGLGAPTAMVEVPDGRILITEQHGAVRVVEPSGVLVPTPALQLGVDSIVERGLLGIALDPGFEQNGYVYLYYTVPTSPAATVHNRVSRFTLVGNTLDPASEFVLVDLDPLGHGAHNSGAMRFGNDGKLYVAVGDNVVPANAQLATNYFGKILRFNPDGTIPADNPATIDGIATAPQGAYRAIYAAGLRNPFTFDVDPVTGSIYVNDVGQDAVEEVNELAAGRNYGWSATEGPFDPVQFPDFTPPIISYLHAPSTTETGYAVTGGSFYRPGVATFPEQYSGDYFFNDYVNGWIRSYDVATGTHTLFASKLNGLNVLGLETAEDGSLLVLAFGSGAPADGALYRIQYTDSPSIVSHPASATRNPGQFATFSVEANSTLPLFYQWQRDGVDIPNATESTYTLNSISEDDDGAIFRVVVRNVTESVTSNPAKLTVSNDLAPLPVILTPVVDTTFEYGQTVTFFGAAIDFEDGSLPTSMLSWRVDYITGDAAPRPFMPETAGIAGGSVTLPTTSPYTRTDVAYRFVLTATDSFGNSVSVSRDIIPALGTATLTSDLPEATVFLDGVAHAPPFEFEGVVGQERTLSGKATVTVGGLDYEFSQWSDGVADRTRTIAVAENGIEYRAVYLSEPVIGTATLASDLPEATLFLDGEAHAPPFEFEGIVGEGRSISASANVTVAGQDYTFQKWSDGVTDRTRTVSVAKAGIEYRANYVLLEEPPASDATIAVGNGGGFDPTVKIFNPTTGNPIATYDLNSVDLPPGAAFTETRVAHGDVNGDGIADIVVGNGPGGQAYVVIFDGATGAVMEIILAFESTFTGGVYVATGDLDGDGRADVIVTPDRGGGPRVRVYRNGDSTDVLADFFGIDDVNFRGGARASVGDIDGDGRADLVVAAGFEGGPRVAAYDGRTVPSNVPVKLFNDFFAFEETLRNGVYVTVGDIDGDGKAEIVAGGGPGGGPRITIFSAAALLASNDLQPVANFFAGDQESRNGVRLGITDIDGDSVLELVVGTAPGVTGQVLVYRATEIMSAAQPQPDRTITAFEDDFTGGVFVG